MVIELKYHGKDKANIFIYNQFYTFIAYFIRMVSLCKGEWSGNMCFVCTGEIYPSVDTGKFQWHFQTLY